MMTADILLRALEIACKDPNYAGRGAIWMKYCVALLACEIEPKHPTDEGKARALTQVIHHSRLHSLAQELIFDHDFLRAFCAGIGCAPQAWLKHIEMFAVIPPEKRLEHLGRLLESAEVAKEFF